MSAASAQTQPERTPPTTPCSPLGPVLEALGRLEPPPSLIPEVATFLETILGDVPPFEEALDRAAALHPVAAQLVGPLRRREA